MHTFMDGELLTAANLNAAFKDTLLLAHPVGSYYWSSNNTSPEKLFGGTWERVENTFIYAASDEHPVGEKGGEETHTLTTEEMPSHTHYPPVAVTFGGSAGVKRSLFATSSDFWSRGDAENAVTETGGDQPHNNMPPYIAAYCWHRTA